MNPNPEMMTYTYVKDEAIQQPRQKKRRKRVGKIVLLVFAWTAFLTAGAFAMHLYIQQLISSVETELYTQTKQQMIELEQTYSERLQELKQSVNGELAHLQSEVETFNEMLTFAEDLAGDKTDESNKLYTRLEQLEAHLTQLAKNLEMLK